MKKNRVKIPASAKIVIILFAVLVVLMFLTGLIFFNSNLIDNYSYLINESGKIRGGAQRFTKLTLSGNNTTQSADSIDEILDHLINFEEKTPLFFFDRNNKIELDLLLQNWEVLKNKAEEYKKGATTIDDLIDVSEKFWVQSNIVVKLIEDNAHRSIKIFYIVQIAIISSISLLIYIIIITKKLIRDKLEIQAVYDNLTGLHNRHYFNEVIDRQIQLGKRYERKFSILMCDIDHFKVINDTFGHNAGDKVLMSIAGVMKKISRESDVIARFGGEEFIILSESSAGVDLLNFAERLRVSIEELYVLNKIKVTISIGVTEWKTDESVEQVIGRADKALYMAKDSGRNRVYLM